MKILVLLYALSSGGAERFAVELSNELVEAGHQVTVVTTDNDAIGSNSFNRAELRPEVQYINLGARSGHQLSALLGINRVIRQLKPDVVHANTQLIPILLPLLCFRRAQYVNTIHNVAECFLKSPLLKPLYRHLYKHRVTPVTISGYCSQSFRSLYGLDTDVTIVNGRNRPACSEEAGAVRAKMEAFSQGHPVFIHMARYSTQKNQQVLFEALHRFSQVRLVVLGKDYPDSLIQSEDVSRVWFAGEQHHVADYLACSNYFILSSLFEGLPITLLEALSYGVVPISTPAGGVVDVIRDGENGFLAYGFDADALEAAIQRALSSPIDREQMKEEYQRNYTMRVCAARYEQLFKSLL